jgi:ribosomal protein S18 acetylase RimI-like enzyme
MLKKLEPGAGYIFYVAVAKAHREMGVAALLVRDALGLFRTAGMTDAFASVEQDNVPSERLFAAEGFTRTSLADVSKRFGLLQALNMYRMMVVVPGEALLHRTLDKVT